jgi:urease accessory protein
MSAAPSVVARVGSGRVVARQVGGATVLAEARATSPLRFVAPTYPQTSAAALCLVSFGGGLVDGDAIDVEVTVEAGATLVVFTQSSTKVFRGSSSQSLSAKVEGTLVFLPDPVAAFAGARYTQRIDVDLVGEGSCVVCDGMTSGRAAYGERWAMETLDLRLTITREGRTLLRDALRLEDGIASRLDRFDAMASLVAIGPRTTPVARAIAEPGEVGRDLVIASSALDAGGAIARIAATSPARALEALRHRIRNLPDIEAVDPWVARH